MAGGHPSDADREAASLPALQRLLRACRERDAPGIAALYRDDACWLADGATVTGGVAAARRHAAVAEGAASWDEPQQRGARAVLRWTAPDGARGAVVVEVRRGLIVFAASL